MNLTTREIEERISAIDFLGEEDYLYIMNGPCAEWREAHVKEGEIHSFDGTRLHYYMAVPENPVGNVVLVHGLCEFFGKYHELCWYLYRAGFSWFFLEQRGHGKSEGKLPEPDADIVHIDTYQKYVRDLRSFMEKVVNHEKGAGKTIAFGHSMGGCITALYAESHTADFDAAVLSSPMFRIRKAQYPMPVVTVLNLYATLLREKRVIAPGERHFPEEPPFKGSSARSRERYDYLFEQRREDRDYQTFGVTIGWVIESLKAIAQLMRNAKNIKLPVTLMSAGQDNLVDIASFDSFISKVPQTVRYHYEDSAHEIYNAETETRRKFYRDLLTVLYGYC